MTRSIHIYGVGAVTASIRKVAEPTLRACLTAACSCVDLPWQAQPPGLSPGHSLDPVAEQASGSPAPAESWHAPPIDRGREYSLAELIDLAERNNPETRGAWEEARAASARLGGARSVYFPSLALLAEGGALRTGFPTPSGTFTVFGPLVEPQVELAWTLLDVTRFDRVPEARALVARAKFRFTRKHQEVSFAVVRAYYALTASRALLEAARATLSSAIVVEEAAEARFSVGLATQPEILLTRQERLHAAFDVEAAVGAVDSAEGALAESVGIPPDPPLTIAPVSRTSGSRELGASVQEVLRLTLVQRPDLKALRSEVLARKAEEQSALGRFLPRLSLDVDAGYERWWYGTKPGGAFNLSLPVFDAHLRVDWNLFAGFADIEAVRQAAAERAASEQALGTGSLRALREAWTAYFDLQTAERKVEFADALLASSEEAYSATLETYRRGLGTLIELLTAERELASARGTAIESRTELMTAAAALTLASGVAPAGP